MRHVILDTDIGTDVDDMLALVFLARATEVCLEGVTTVHGNTLLRAKIAKITCQMLGIPDLPIVAGTSETLSGHPIFWPGHEGENIPGLENVRVESGISAQQFLFECSEKYQGDLEILAIGPLTNLAQTISWFPAFRSGIKRLYLMGGAYWKDYPEHNIEMDVLAAKIVFESGIPITAIGLDVTLRVWIREREVERIRKLPNDLGSMLEGQIKRWWRFLGTDQNNPHDPLAALAMVRPDLFSFAPCDVAICLENDRRGRLIRRDDPNGKISAAYDLDVHSAERLLLSYIAG
jgi:inosine-uridine nucleoside N-ribohydrolase